MDFQEFLPYIPDGYKLVTSGENMQGFPAKFLVLVDKKTASSAEIIAQALREAYGPEGCKIAGTQTAGEVLEGRLMALNETYCLNYPAADYVTGKGYRIQDKGVVLDVIIKSEDGNLQTPLELAKAMLEQHSHLFSWDASLVSFWWRSK
jgi:C-terminal processing protease CtpA/Prc